MAVEIASRRPVAVRLLSVAWALSPLLLAIPAAPGFAWAAWRLRSRRLGLAAVGYALATVAFFVLAAQPNGSSANEAAGSVGLVVMVGATVHALIVRKRVFSSRSRPVQQASETTAAPAPAAPAPVRAWAEPLPPLPGDSVSADCTGTDEHRIGASPGVAAMLALAGSALIALDVWLHLHGAVVPTGSALLIVGVVSPLFARRLDGPVFSYRRWGTAHQLRLDAVTEVSTKGRRTPTTLALTAPGLDKPATILLNRPGARSDAVREHLRRWLNRRGVAVTPAAAALLSDGSAAPFRAMSRRSRVVTVMLTTLGPVVFLGIGIWQLSGAPAHFARAAASHRMQAAPEQIARVESRHVTEVDTRSCTCHNSTYQVLVLSSGRDAVVHAHGRWAAQPGQLVEIRTDPQDPAEAEFPGAPYYTRHGAELQVIVGGLALVFGLGLLTLVAALYRRVRAMR